MRRLLLELIHRWELKHQDYVEALGFDAYRARRWEHPDVASDVLTDAINAGSFAVGLRAILARSDDTDKNKGKGQSNAVE